MSFLTQKPKHYKDEEIIATRMGWELKKTGEILSSFAFAGGLPNAVESVYLKKHGLTIGGTTPSSGDTTQSPPPASPPSGAGQETGNAVQP